MAISVDKAKPNASGPKFSVGSAACLVGAKLSYAVIDRASARRLITTEKRCFSNDNLAMWLTDLMHVHDLMQHQVCISTNKLRPRMQHMLLVARSDRLLDDARRRGAVSFGYMQSIQHAWRHLDCMSVAYSNLCMWCRSKTEKQLGGLGS